MNGGLCGNTEIGDDMKKSFPWVLLPIFSKVALNNAGRKEQCVQKKVGFPQIYVLVSHRMVFDIGFEIEISKIDSRFRFASEHFVSKHFVKIYLHVFSFSIFTVFWTKVAAEN
jgi:hypothetical protein